jgi:hypothetical protein
MSRLRLVSLLARSIREFHKTKGTTAPVVTLLLVTTVPVPFRDVRLRANDACKWKIDHGARP